MRYVRQNLHDLFRMHRINLVNPEIILLILSKTNRYK
jgi:hypothetical protein